MVKPPKKLTTKSGLSSLNNSEPEDIPYKSPFILEHTNYVTVREAPTAKKVTYFFERQNIKNVKLEDEFLIIGFDTEYKSPKEGVSHEEVKQRKARYEILSYQFYALDSKNRFWSGIIIPDELERISFTDLIVYSISKGITDKIIEEIPNQIYLVAHYNRADIPAFDDKDDFIKKLNNVRKSLVTRDLPIKIKINYNDEPKYSTSEFFQDFELAPSESSKIDECLNVYIRDTILLAPTGQKSLSELGDLVGVKKIVLSLNRKREKCIKENMDILLKRNWNKFKEYALMDAEICAKYFNHIAEKYYDLMKTRRIPSALSNIGTKLLINEWKNGNNKIEHLHAVGKEEFTQTVWKREKQQFITIKKNVYYEEISWFIDFVTETYHGGRNEQFWFGPSYIADWSDYDLTGAYPTAMAMIGQPFWDKIYTSTSIKDYTPETLGFACVDFKFKNYVRYPILPIRTDNGIIFPRSGRCYCSAPEIALALKLGCELSIRHGIIIPQDKNKPIFFDFLKDTITNRQNSSSELEKAFWKEITNSSYGKTAQGLRKKRVFNIQREANQQLPESQITNPYFASYITSFVRACVGEIINLIPNDKMVFSVTTDGFITDANEQEIHQATSGTISSLFSNSRLKLSNNHEVLSKKHSVQQVLGWKTRGQATLIKGEGEIKNKKLYILAKAGIQPPPLIRDVWEQNDYIVDLFFNRYGSKDINVDVHTSLRDMILYHADLVNKTSERRLNMEYDFKRRPISVSEKEIIFDNKKYNHLVFNTSAWTNVEEFKSFRSMFDNYRKNNERSKFKLTDEGVEKNEYQCLKTKDDFERLAIYYDTRNSLPVGDRRYLSKKNNADVQRLKRDICRAFKQGQAGLENYSDLTANQFIDRVKGCGFTDLGIKFARADIENAGRNEFEPHTTPRTKRVNEIINRIKRLFPKLDKNLILSNYDNEIPFNDAVKYKGDGFMKKKFKL